MVLIIKTIADKCSDNNKSSSNSNIRHLPKESSSRREKTENITIETSKANSRADKTALSQLKNRYKVPEIPEFTLTIDMLQKDMESYQSPELIQSVNRLACKRKDKLKNLTSIKKELDELLLCSESSSAQEYIDCLQNNEELLKKRKTNT